MRLHARSFAAWLADVFLGPRCPYGCNYRARGPRSLAAHAYVDHAGDPTPRSTR